MTVHVWVPPDASTEHQMRHLSAVDVAGWPQTLFL